MHFLKSDQVAVMYPFIALFSSPQSYELEVEDKQLISSARLVHSNM